MLFFFAFFLADLGAALAVDFFVDDFFPAALEAPVALEANVAVALPDDFRLPPAKTASQLSEYFFVAPIRTIVTELSFQPKTDGGHLSSLIARRPLALAFKPITHFRYLARRRSRGVGLRDLAAVESRPKNGDADFEGVSQSPATRVGYFTLVGKITIGTPSHCNRRCSEKAVSLWSNR